MLTAHLPPPNFRTYISLSIWCSVCCADEQQISHPTRHAAEHLLSSSTTNTKKNKAKFSRSKCFVIHMHTTYKKVNGIGCNKTPTSTYSVYKFLNTPLQQYYEYDTQNSCYTSIAVKSSKICQQQQTSHSPTFPRHTFSFIFGVVRTSNTSPTFFFLCAHSQSRIFRLKNNTHPTAR